MNSSMLKALRLPCGIFLILQHDQAGVFPVFKMAAFGLHEQIYGRIQYHAMEPIHLSAIKTIDCGGQFESTRLFNCVLADQ